MNRKDPSVSPLYLSRVTDAGYLKSECDRHLHQPRWKISKAESRGSITETCQCHLPTPLHCLGQVIMWCRKGTDFFGRAAEKKNKVIVHEGCCVLCGRDMCVMTSLVCCSSAYVVEETPESRGRCARPRKTKTVPGRKGSVVSIITNHSGRRVAGKTRKTRRSRNNRHICQVRLRKVEIHDSIRLRRFQTKGVFHVG